MSPFQALYSYPPPSLGCFDSSGVNVAKFDDWLQNKEQLTRFLQSQFLIAQNRMKQFVDMKRTERSFEVGDWVYLKMQPHQQLSMKSRWCVKLSPKFYGPFEILQRIGPVAYKLKLLADALIHDIFHVSLLKKKVGNNQVVSSVLPKLKPEHLLLVGPVAILYDRVVNKDGQQVEQVLVQWDSTSADSTWEGKSFMLNQFPHFILEDNNCCCRG